jgi:heme exporter protein A
MPAAPVPQDATPPPALAVEDLARAFGHVRALRGISFTLDAGSVLAVFGPNGAGKTTLLRILAGLLRPDGGAVRIHGQPLVRGDAVQRRRLGLISHASLCYDGLTAAENLEFFAKLYGLPDPGGVARTALAGVGLEARADALTWTMSRGMLQRLAIARALLHDPEVVLLDEPFTGLDQRAAAALRDQLVRLRTERRTVVLVTHNLEEGLDLATHVAIQVGGRFVTLGPRAGGSAEYRARYAEATAGTA